MKFLVFLLAAIALASAFHAAVKFDDMPSYCIILDADATGYITYADAFSNETKKYDFKVSKINYTNGKCAGVTNKTTTEQIVLAFYPNEVVPSIARDPWELTINFKENTEQTNNAYKIVSYSLSAILYDNIFPNATQDNITFVQDPTAELEWHGEQTAGFSCSKSGLPFVGDASIVFEHLKVIAFGLLETPEFPSNQNFEQCKLDVRTSDVVPIVVGACLAALVIVVLIAYLIGRARAKRQGYASV